MIIRKADVSHIPELGRLLCQVNDLHAKGRPDIFILGQRKYTDWELGAVLNDPASPVFVAEEEDGNVLGYAFCLMEEVSRHNLVAERSLYIDDICVDEAARGKGVGSGLFRFVSDFAREQGCRRITLNVWKLNTGAEEFYQKMGMTPLKTVMEKIL